MTSPLDRVTMSAMFSNGNSFGASAGNLLSPGFGEGHLQTVPTWRFGLRQSDDRGGM